MMIRGRGNSTWGMPKKPYRIKLDVEHHMLGMSANNRDWVLLSNYADKSLIRNALAFKIGQWVELEFTPEFRFVDVILNGEYVGNYMITDQIEVANNRVPVEKQDTSMLSLPAITGGYLLEIDGFANSEPVWFQTDQGVKTTIKYPDDDEINDAQLNYIKDYIQNYEDVLMSEDFKNPETGFRSLTDSATLVNWYIASELTGNPDCFWSTYIYKKRLNDKLFYGPLWDYDIAFNNDSRQGDAVNKLMRESAYNPKVWINRLWQDEWFVRAVGKRWEHLVEWGIADSIQKYINAASDLIEISQEENFERWNNIDSKVYLEQFLFETWEENIGFLRDYVDERVHFLNENLAEYVDPFVIEDYYYSIRNIRSGLVIDINNENPNELNMWEPVEDKLSQQWEINELADGSVRFINRLSGLAIREGGKNNSLTLTEEMNGDDSQRWRLEPTGTGNTFGIINEENGMAVDNAGGGTANGTRVILWDNDILGNQNQQWVFDKIESIYSALNGKYKDLNITVYPNPVNHTLHISLDVPQNWSLLCEIYDLSGQLVESQLLDQPSVNVSQLEPGIYFVRLSYANQARVFRIIKQ